MDNEIYSRIELVEYKISNDEEWTCKGVVRYLGEEPTEDIIEFSETFCEGLINNLTHELAEWHYKQNVPLAIFYYNDDKSNIYLKTPYEKYLEYDGETASNGELVVEFYNGTATRDKETRDIIYVYTIDENEW